MFSFKELIILQSLPVWKQLVSVGVDCSLTFDLEVGQRVEQRVLGHQLLVDGVLETHGAGVGARHRQIRLHGWINEQGVRWKTHKAAWARGRQQSDTFAFLQPFNETDTINKNNWNPEGRRGEWSCTTATWLISQWEETNGKQQRTGWRMCFTFDVRVISGNLRN